MLFKQENQISIELLQYRNELELIRNLAQDGEYSPSEQAAKFRVTKQFFIKFSVIMVPLLLTTWLAEYAYFSWFLEHMESSYALWSIYFLMTVSPISINYMRTIEKKIDLHKPYKTSSFDSKIRESFERAIERKSEEMTFDSLEKAASVLDLLQNMYCSKLLQVKESKLPTEDSGRKSNFQIKAKEKSRLRLPPVEQPQMKIKEFSTDDAGDVEAAQIHENESIPSKKAVLKKYNNQ